MRVKTILGKMVFAAAMVAAGLTGGPASALPLAGAPAAGDGLLVQVRGCHRDVERHFVPEFGRRAWHYHRGSSCRPIEVDAPRPPAPPPPEDCHRDVRRHFVPEFGRRVTHRHVGPRCRIQVFEEVGPGARPPSGVCVSIGGVQFCLNE